MHLQWNCKPFLDLVPLELYAILQLRNEVFVVEQKCIFQDADGKDPYAFHLMGWRENMLVAYTRLVPAGIIYTEPSIGRVVISQAIRGTGAGRDLMIRSIYEVNKIWNKPDIRIGAQLYLKKFYESLGFVQSGDAYMEDDIEHIQMILHRGNTK